MVNKSLTYQKIKLLFDDMRFSEVDQFCKDALLEKNVDCELVFSISQLYASIEQIDKAIYLNEKLVTFFYSNERYSLHLATLYSKFTNWKDVSDLYKIHVDKHNIVANSFFNLAYYTKKKGDYSTALALYKLSLDYNVSSPEEAYLNISVIYSENFRQEIMAIDALKLALQCNKSYVPALYNLAGLFEEQGQFQLASEYYFNIIEKEPNNVFVLARLAGFSDSVKGGSLLISAINNTLDSNVISEEERITLGYALGKVLDDNKHYDDAFNAYTLANFYNGKLSLGYEQKQSEGFFESITKFYSEKWFDKLTIISNEKPIFICGMYRSGSTLLEQVLSAHDQVHSGGELQFFDKYPYKDINKNPEYLLGISTAEYNKMASDYINELNFLFEGYTNVINKKPDNSVNVGLIKTLFPKAIIIYTVREPLDNCLSVFFQQLDRKLTYSTSLLNIAHYYNEEIKLMNHWKKIFPEDVFIVKYEDLVINPKLATKAVFTQLGLAWEEQCEEFYLNHNSVKTASLWQVRQPLYTKSCQRWLNYEKQVNSLKGLFN